MGLLEIHKHFFNTLYFSYESAIPFFIYWSDVIIIAPFVLLSQPFFKTLDCSNNNLATAKSSSALSKSFERGSGRPIQ